MANEQKKYASLESLQTFKTNTDNLYATKVELEELSLGVAYINVEDNATIENPDVSTSEIAIDSALSTTSTNPVQNKVITEQFNQLSETVANLEESGTDGSGISEQAKTLLINILLNAIYENDQSANITALESALASGNDSGGESGGNYTIINNLTNVTNTSTSGLVLVNGAYIATLVAAEGYSLDAVTVTMGGEDVTASVYSNGTITIDTVTGNIVITASAIEISNCLWYWDFTSGSWVDKNAGLKAIQAEDATIDSSGAHTASDTSYVCLPFAENMTGRTVEIKFGNFELFDTGAALRLLMSRGDSTGVASAGLFWSTKDCWTGLTSTETEFKDINMFSGKTAYLKFTSSSSMDVYCDTQLIMSAIWVPSNSYVFIGSSTSSAYPVTIESVKVYATEE